MFYKNKWAKIGHFQNSESIFEVKYLLNLPENNFLIRILIKITTFIKIIFISFNFDQLYSVNLCPIFSDSLQNLSDS